MGLSFNKETIEGMEGVVHLELQQEEEDKIIQVTSQLRCPESLLRRHQGLRSGQGGFCSDQATVRRGLCWRKPKGSSRTADSPLTTALNPCPWGGPGEEACFGGDCLMICQQRTRQTDFWQLPGCNRRVDFYSHPRRSLQAKDKRKSEGDAVRAGEGLPFGLSIPLRLCGWCLDILALVPLGISIR